MIQLYHNDMSTCAQKVRLALQESRIEWQSHHLSLRDNDQLQPAFLRINPKGQVPAIIDGDTVVVESTVINEYIVDAYGCDWLLPRNAPGRARMRWWTRQVDDDVFQSIAIISQAIAFRRQADAVDHGMIDRNVASVPDEARREMKRIGARAGLNNPSLPMAVRRVNKLLGEMDAALALTQWLASDDISLADIGLVPFVLRLKHLAMPVMFEGRPYLEKWFARMQERPSYAAAVAAWLKPGLLKAWEKSGAEAQPLISAMLKII